ncbi:MAG: flippase-like domain-containing protein [Acidobacteriota bacterium]|nr:flippase-like domain-containing protein [Acidobacteriota bacterium]
MDRSDLSTAETGAPPPGGRPARSWVTAVIKIVVSLGLLALLLARTNIGDLWQQIHSASMVWLAAALLVYFGMTLVGVWRWGLLLSAQQVPVGRPALFASYVVALFFNNFLPSNIGGDVFRIADTARPAGSKTLAATVVLVDRAMGLLGLTMVAAVGSTLAAGAFVQTLPIRPRWLWTAFALATGATAAAVMAPNGFGRLLRPLAVFHAEWVGTRIAQITEALHRFRARVEALVGCLAAAIVVQSAFVVYYASVSHALHVPIPFAALAVITPVSFLLQMIPVSINGFGVREAAFSYFFTRLGLSLSSALAVSLVGAGLMMLFSLSGALAYMLRRSPVGATTPTGRPS